MPEIQARPTALTIAGSDSSAGAGIQADLKTFAAFRVYGTSAIAAITAQNTTAVTLVYPVPPDVLAAQIDAVLSDIGAGAVKTGMLARGDLVEVVAQKVRQWHVVNLVVDPVMIASTGATLLDASGVAALRELLLPLAHIVTPNLAEAAALSGRRVSTIEDCRAAAVAIADLGSRNVLITGGHLPGDEAVDLLFDGRQFAEFPAPRVDTEHTHGTGCTFSAALAANLALGKPLPEAIAQAKQYVSAALRSAFSPGHGCGSLNHHVPAR